MTDCALLWNKHLKNNTWSIQVFESNLIDNVQCQASADLLHIISFGINFNGFLIKMHLGVGGNECNNRRRLCVCVCLLVWVLILLLKTYCEIVIDFSGKVGSIESKFFSFRSFNILSGATETSVGIHFWRWLDLIVVRLARQFHDPLNWN